jgi:hypothetical protein
MTHEEYNEALKSPHWVDKRDFIKKRDNYKCVKCSCEDNLEVHHTYYLKDKMPWEVPDDCLITLCRSCHQKEHNKKSIGSFFRQKPPKENSENKKTVVKKLSSYKFIAIEANNFQKIYTNPFKINVIKKVCKSVNGIIKGFDDIKSAKLWIKRRVQNKKKKRK